MVIILIVVLYLIIALIAVGGLYYFRPFHYGCSSVDEENGCYVGAGILFPATLIAFCIYFVFKIPFVVVDHIKRGKRCR